MFIRRKWNFIGKVGHSLCHSYLVDLVDLSQAVDVGCPTVEKEYGKQSHNYINLCT